MEEEPKTNARFNKIVVGIFAFPFLYLLSSGPVLAIAFWLREHTGWDGFYAVMWLYYPLFRLHDSPFDGPVGAYLVWWIKAFGTVGPG